MKRFALTVVALSLFACGGTKYYVVKNPDTNQTYFTTEYKTLDGGAIKLKDAKTNSEVTLQTSQVKEVSKAEYDAQLYAPAPAAVPAAAPAQPTTTKN